MFTYVIVTFLCCSATGADFDDTLKQYIPIYQSRIRQNYSNCNLFFKSSTFIQKSIVNWYASKNHCANIIISKKFDFKSRVAASQADFHFFESVQDINNTISLLPEDFLYEGKGDAHFIISTKVIDFRFLLPTLKFLWNKHFVNCVIVFVYKKLEIFGYDAFRNIALDLVACGNCLLFPPAIGNFWGYPLRVNLFEEQPLLRRNRDKWIGRDYNIMMEVVKATNATLQVIEAPGGFAGAAKHMTNNRSDACFVSMLLLSKFEMNEVDHSYPEHFNNIVLVVPRGPKLPQYHNLFYIFDKHVWMYLMIVMFGVAFGVKMISRCDGQENTYIYCFLDVYRSFLQQGVWNFLRKYHRAKLLMVFWFYFSVIFGTAFQTSLMSMIIKAKYMEELNTFADVRNVGVPLFVPRIYADVIPKEYGLHELFRPVHTMNQIHDLIYTSNIFSGYIMHEDAARVYVDIMRSRDNKPRYHIVGEKLVPGVDTYMFQKKSPFIKIVNRMLLLISQFGLRDNWIRNAPVIGSSSKSAIKIGNLQGALCLLGLGYIISTVCFVAELLVHSAKNGTLL